MSEFKGTSGPWEQTGSIIWKGGDNGAVICQMSEPFEQFVEHKPLRIGSKGWDLQMSNARLIAAAPEYHQDTNQIRQMMSTAFRNTSSSASDYQSKYDYIQKVWQSCETMIERLNDKVDGRS